MDSYRVIKVRLGGAHLQSNGKTLQHFVRTVSDAMDTNNLLFFTHRNQLHSAWLAMAGESAVHGSKATGVNLNVLLAMTLDGFVFTQTYGANGGVTEDDRCDIVVVQVLFWFVVKQSF